MNFRELIIERIYQLLKRLEVPDSQVQQGSTSDIKLITPNTRVNPDPDEHVNYVGVLRDVEYGPIEELPIANPRNTAAPKAFISFDGGRNDLAVDTFLSHIIEVVSIRIEVLLDKKIGVADGDSPNGVRPITLQASDLVADITSLVNLQSLQTAVHTLEIHITVQDAVLQEWEFDDRYRGADQEVLIMIFQAEVANVRQ